MYGVISKGILSDTSLTLHGAKCHATRNGCTKIGYRVGYNVVETYTKVKNRWIKD